MNGRAVEKLKIIFHGWIQFAGELKISTWGDSTSATGKEGRGNIAREVKSNATLLKHMQQVSRVIM